MRLGIRVLLHASRKPSNRLKKIRKGDGAPKGAYFFAVPCAGTARATHNGYCYPSALRARSPFGAPPRLWPHNRMRGSAQAGFPATCLRRALPAVGCPSPAVHPADRLLIAGRRDARAARDKVTSPVPGTAPAPSIGRHRLTSLPRSRRRVDTFAGDKCQVWSLKVLVAETRARGRPVTLRQRRRQLCPVLPGDGFELFPQLR